MSKFEELIAKVCPAGVEFKTLGDIARLVRGNGMPKADLTDEGVGAIHYGQIYTRYRVWASSTFSFVAPETATRLTTAEPGDIIITNTSENLEDVGKAVAWLGRESIVTGGHATVVKHHEDPKYLSYWFQSESFFAQKRALATGTKVVDVSAKKLMKVRVPVPPLEVQREIVRVLDQFTQLEAELEAELAARRAQYEHYRYALLSDDHVPDSRKIPLGDMFDLRAGVHIKSAEISDEQTENKPYPCYGGNGHRGYVSSFNYDESVLLVGRQGALCGNVHRAEGKIYATEHAVVVTPKIPVDMSWAFHKLTQMDLNQYKTKSAQPGLAVGRVKQVEAHYVPVEDQRRDAAVLDKLDALVNDLSIGLPAELAARRKQYEHYRDKLLAFEEVAV